MALLYLRPRHNTSGRIDPYSLRPDAGVLEVVATANNKGGAIGSDKIPMPSSVRIHLEKPLKFPRVRMSDDAVKDEIFAVVAERYQWSKSSIIVGDS